MTGKDNIPAIRVKYTATGCMHAVDELSMRPMQAWAYAKRGEQYLI